ncbi:CueP family metal-binding protein [Occultella aeris]|uniref:CueP family metal-binding protein n=2 Tax=Occultella aeris TaxID=2761496 RepID=A0A7M4DKR4_9MICO|nr:hypothetical protein HALOF300_02728 [Occultella aeris]
MVLAGCGTAADSEEPVADAAQDESLLAEHGLQGLDAREIVDHLDSLAAVDRPVDLMASVRAEELVLTDATADVALDMPEDVFYLAVAPYVAQTHECYFHSLTTCQGELVEQDVQVRVTDESTGQVLVDEVRTTFENGFVGLWVPRGAAGTVEVSYDGKSGVVEYTTGADSATCVTTLQLT